MVDASSSEPRQPPHPAVSFAIVIAFAVFYAWFRALSLPNFIFLLTVLLNTTLIALLDPFSWRTLQLPVRLAMASFSLALVGLAIWEINHVSVNVVSWVISYGLAGLVFGFSPQLRPGVAYLIGMFVFFILHTVGFIK